MHLSKRIGFMTEDAPAMHRICTRIAKRRLVEANVLPAPEGWPAPRKPRPSLFLRCLWAGLLIFHLAAWLLWLALNSAVTP